MTTLPPADASSVATVRTIEAEQQEQQQRRYARFEKVPCLVYRHAEEASRSVAGHIAALIRDRSSEGPRRRPSCVLGLATGSTPVGVYAELIRLHRECGLSFRNVATFNLDEYFPMRPDELQSYRRFMREHLFDHIDIDTANVHIPDGTVAEADVEEHCRRYEESICAAGGIDVQLLGIGRTGHIGFNEPGSGRDSRTRMIALDKITKKDAASDFFGEENVPRRAITMGVGTILEAREVILMAFSEGKAPVVARAVEGEVSPSVAASYLQDHPNARFVLDEAAAEGLTRLSSPWLAGPPPRWDDALIRKAVIWLAKRESKPILKLTEEDYNEAGLQDLLARRGRAYDLNIKVFNDLQRTITGWPGGKPAELRAGGEGRIGPADADDGSGIFPKRVLIFSPHPDDDVISMGGTLIRLVEQGHEVHVAYQTSGNIAVFDGDAVRYVDFVGEFNRRFGIDPDRTAQLEAHIDEFVRRKKPGQVDSAEVQFIKGLVRRCESRAAGRCCGVPEDRLHFLELPFYETGRVRKKPLGERDVALTAELMRRIEPHLVFAAGDLSDPHGTHRTCLSAVLRACRRVSSDGWYLRCGVWLYRGAWQEWPPDRIEMAVPLSPQELMRKRLAIFKHESQKDRAPFPGPDDREFWQRSEQRNRTTAEWFDRLGLAEYEAIEGFVRWKGDGDVVPYSRL